MNRVLVTGASGFIGSHCLPILLKTGYEVHGVIAPDVSPDGADARVIWHTADLLDADQVGGLLGEVRPTHLLHLAWFVAPGAYWESAENVRWLQSGLDLVRGFAEAGGVRSVMAGTCAEYAVSAEPVVECVTPLRPTTLYGACKTALHLSSSAYFATCDVSSAWGHIFYLYGPDERPSRLVPSVINSLAAGGTFVCAHPNDVRDFLHVEDVARAFCALLDSGVEGDVNIASGQPLSVGDLVASLAETVGRPELVEYRSDVPESSRIVGDNTRLRLEVGWEAKFDSREGLAQTADWWRRNPASGSPLGRSEKR